MHEQLSTKEFIDYLRTTQINHINTKTIEEAADRLEELMISVKALLEIK